MYPKRNGQDENGLIDRGTDLAAAETARSAANPPADRPRPDEEKMSVFWRVFGGTILSIVALVAITLYNNLNGSITDLRQELSREREARAGLIKKDDVDTRVKNQWDRIRVVEGYKAEIEGVRERAAANAAAIEAVRKDVAGGVETIKRETTGVELLKERVTLLEGVRKEIAGLEVLKERLATATGDLKAYREELQKVQQEIERNKAGDLERKAFRDSQMRQLDDTLKDIQRGLMDCREKLARLEGAQQPPVGPPAPKPAKPE
jgi:DNA repair exonuclease SbcCD ATPase subunit